MGIILYAEERNKSKDMSDPFLACSGNSAYYQFPRLLKISSSICLHTNFVSPTRGKLSFHNGAEQIYSRVFFF